MDILSPAGPIPFIFDYPTHGLVQNDPGRRSLNTFGKIGTISVIMLSLFNTL